MRISKFVRAFFMYVSTIGQHSKVSFQNKKIMKRFVLAFTLLSFISLAWANEIQPSKPDNKSQYVCKRCDGSGQDPLTFTCSRCNGEREEVRLQNCYSCNGRGYTKDKYGDNVFCTQCDGTGKKIHRTTCSKCHGSGEMKKPCMTCKGAGTVSR